MVKPGYIPAYIKKCTKRRAWRKEKESKTEIGGC